MFTAMGAAVNALPGGEIVPAMDRGLLDAAEFNNATSDRLLGFPDVSKVCMLQSFHQNAEQFEITFNKTKYDALPAKMKAIIAYATEAASADMSWKAIDRYSKDYIELQTKQALSSTRRRTAILQKQLEVFDPVMAKKSADNPLFKEVLESQGVFAERAVQWDLDTYVNRRMAYNHYFGKQAAAEKGVTYPMLARHHPGCPDGVFIPGVVLAKRSRKSDAAIVVEQSGVIRISAPRWFRSLGMPHAETAAVRRQGQHLGRPGVLLAHRGANAC